MRDLSLIRNDLDKIDEEILELLTKRHLLVKEVIEFKLENNLSINQLEREQEMLDRLSAKGKELGLREEVVKEIFTNIIEASKETQKEIAFYEFNK